jgi:hypothetical protein
MVRSISEIAFTKEVLAVQLRLYEAQCWHFFFCWK